MFNLSFQRLFYETNSNLTKDYKKYKKSQCRYCLKHYNLQQILNINYLSASCKFGSAFNLLASLNNFKISLHDFNSDSDNSFLSLNRVETR